MPSSSIDATQPPQHLVGRLVLVRQVDDMRLRDERAHRAEAEGDDANESAAATGYVLKHGAQERDDAAGERQFNQGEIAELLEPELKPRCVGDGPRLVARRHGGGILARDFGHGRAV
jgi:hypothetical protein